MTVRGVIQFVWYIVRIYGRHFRINVERHGTLAALRPSLRGRHAGMGRGMRSNPLGRAHDALDGTPAMLLIRSLQAERAAFHRKADELVAALMAVGPGGTVVLVEP